MSTPRGMIAPWTRSTPSASRNGTYRSSRCRRRTHGREPSSRARSTPRSSARARSWTSTRSGLVTSTTAMVVVVDGVVVFERYADGVAADRPAARQLRHEVRARAADRGRLGRRLARRPRHPRRPARPRALRVRLRPRHRPAGPHHDQRGRVARGLPRSRQRRVTLRAPLAGRHRGDARPPGRDRDRGGAGLALHVLQPGLDGSGLGARARDRTAVRRGTDRTLAADRGRAPCRRRPGRSRRCRRSRARGGLRRPDGARLVAHRHGADRRADRRHRRRAAGVGRCEQPVRAALPAAGTAAEHHHDARRLRLPLVAVGS